MTRGASSTTGGTRPWAGARALARTASLGAALLLAAACAAGGGGEAWTHPHGATNPLVGTVREVATGRAVGEAELVELLAGRDFVLLGEAAGNADHARLSARLVARLAEGGGPRRLAAVALERLPTDAQPLIVEYLAEHPRDGAGLARAVGEAAPGGPRPAQFAPALAAAAASGSQVVAADLPEASLRAVLARGLAALQPDLVRRTGLAEPFATPVQSGLRAELAAASCERAGGRALDALVRARRARDATMADRLAAVTGRGRGLLVATASHVRTDRGVPWYLRQLRPGAGIASLAFVELPEAGSPPPADLPYDYVWFTPAARPAGYDACEALRPPGAGESRGAPPAPDGGGAGDPAPGPARRPEPRLPVAS